MVKLSVTVVDGILGELTPQQVTDWAKVQGIALSVEKRDFDQWTFSAAEEKPEAIRKMLQRQEAGMLNPCSNKRIHIVVERAKPQVSARVPHQPINQVTDPDSIVAQIWASLQLRLSFKGTVADSFLFELESAEPEHLNRLLSLKTVYGEDQYGEDVFVSFMPYTAAQAWSVPGEGMPPPPPPPPPPSYGYGGASYAATSSQKEAQPMVVTHIEIYHDGENCPIPDAEMVTDADGAWVMETTGFKKVPKIKPGKARLIQFEVLKEKLLRRLVECVEGPTVAAAKDLTGLSFNWHFVMSFDKKGIEKWRPHVALKNNMIACGVNFVDPGTKDGAVDVKLKELLNKAERRWTHVDEDEKKGLLCVLIAGDCDYGDNVRQLRKYGPCSPGVQVCIVYSKNAPAKAAFLQHVPQAMIVDEWSQIVENSRLAGEEAHEGDDRWLKIQPPKMKFLRIMNRMPEFEQKLQGVHPAFSLNSSPGWLEIVADPSATTEHILRARHVISGLLEDIVQDGALSVKGFTPTQLHADAKLQNLAQMRRVCLFIPGLGAAKSKAAGKAPEAGMASPPAVTLRANQLFVWMNGRFDYTVAKDLCWQVSSVAIHQFQQVGSYCVATIDLIRHKHDLLIQAKAKLLQLKRTDIAFSDKPFTPETSTGSKVIQMQMKHPTLWKADDVEKLKKRNRLTFEFQEEARVYKDYASRVVSCTPSERARMLGCTEKNVSFKDRVGKAISVGSAEASSVASGPSARATAILVYEKGNEGEVAQVESYIKDLSIETEEVFLLTETKQLQFAEYQLLNCTWPRIEARLRRFGLQDVAKEDGTKPVALLTGKAADVQEACNWLKEKVETIQVLKEDFGQQKFQNWLDAVKTYVKSVIRGRSRSSMPEADDSPASSDEGSFMGYSISGSVVKLACFPEDLEEAKDLMEEIKSFCQAYDEQWWQMPSLPVERKSQVERIFWKSDFTHTLKQTFNLSRDPTWWKHSLELCGRTEDVAAAVDSLSAQCAADERAQFAAKILPALSWLLFKDKDRFMRLRQQLVDSHPGSKLFLSTGKLTVQCRKSLLQGAQDWLEKAMQALDQGLERKTMQLSENELDFLKNLEGERILRQIVKIPAWHDFLQEEQSLMAHCRLPNGCDLELRHGDILSSNLGIRALVNSANEQLLTLQVGGIAAKIKAQGGPALVEECRQILAERQVNVTEVAVTDAHALKSAGFEKIFHAVPPVYKATQQAAREMEATVLSILMEVRKADIDSVVLPALGAGIFGWQDASSTLTERVLRALAFWGENESASASPKRVVIMDTNKKILKEFVNALDNFDDMEEQPHSPVPRQEPVFHPPSHPQYLWVYDCSDTGRGWVAYDYDQASQLDAAFEGGEGRAPLFGDRSGKPSDSAHIEPGNTFATYEVDFSQRGADHCAKQYNTKSRYSRKVQALPLGSVEEAVQKLPMYKEQYDARKKSHEEALKEWRDEASSGQSSAPRPPKLHRASSLRRIFSKVSSEATSSASGLQLTGFDPLATKAEKLITKHLQTAREKTAPMRITLGAGETFQEAVANFEDFVARRGHVQLKVETQEDSLVLNVLGKTNLSTAQSEFHAWDRDRAWRARDQLLEQNQATFSATWFRAGRMNSFRPGEFLAQSVRSVSIHRGLLRLASGICLPGEVSIGVGCDRCRESSKLPRSHGSCRAREGPAADVR
ncbi:unnamed protein product [Effrenium voratum]|uniref:Macro domain-containing protein n=1 Tax=Effrenium voratum TaxID=2562239 RepID=A0AA36IF78_9DINO|nr:unnamed protein product [Effrenium voratum]